jgi:hypothetical protein
MFEMARLFVPKMHAPHITRRQDDSQNTQVEYRFRVRPAARNEALSALL